MEEVEKKPESENTGNTDVPNQSATKPQEEKKEQDLDQVSDLINLIFSDKEVRNLTKSFISHIGKIISRHPISKSYLVIFLYQPYKSISEEMADKIYNAIPPDNKKPILLILHSKGGRIEPAYLISKTCKEYSSKFVVAVPRKAKSAATLISLGGDEIHMGPMSELGPIDPQFGGLPALGLSSSLESLAKVVTKFPDSSQMFANFLSEKLDLRILGYFERVSESAVQYAQRLLTGKKLPKSIQEVANQFVYEYKDHSFVLDKEEAVQFLGDQIKVNTDEYRLANDIHLFLAKLNTWMPLIRDKNMSIVGALNDIIFTEAEKDE